MLVFVAIITMHRDRLPGTAPSVRDDGIASLFYVANWRFIAAKQSYFELFSAASPLRHMWTLAIEEQFYLVWPLVAYAALRARAGLAARARRGLRGRDRRVGRGDGDRVPARAIPLRAYYGTDARAHTILMGALLAIVLVVWTPGAAAKRRLRIASAIARSS